MSDMPDAGSPLGGDHPGSDDGTAAVRARNAAGRSTGFGIASTIVAALAVAGILSTGAGSGSLEYVVFMILALVVILPLGILGLVFGSLGLARAHRAGTSTSTAIAGLALSGLGTVVALAIRLWAETF